MSSPICLQYRLETTRTGNHYFVDTLVRFLMKVNTMYLEISRFTLSFESLKAGTMSIFTSGDGVVWHAVPSNFACQDPCTVTFDPFSQKWLWNFRLDSDDRTRLSFLGVSEIL